MEKEKNAMQRLNDLIKEKNSRVCAGLDPEYSNIPFVVEDSISTHPKLFGNELRLKVRDIRSFIKKDAADIYDETIYKYCKEYINAIKDVVPAIKVNSAFFERDGNEEIYWKVAEFAKENGLFVIGDVKRADSGSTSKAYAEAFLFAGSPFDAITINPYFGTDGVMPFLELAKKNGKGVFVLVKTSNKSSAEVQDLKLGDGRFVYEAVADLVEKWGEEVDPYNERNDYNMVGAEVGATYSEQIKKVVGRTDAFLLIPDYDDQGATANDVAAAFDKQGTGAIVNSSRGIMQAYKKECWKDKYSEETWAEASRAEAIRATNEINQAINKFYGLNIC